MIQPWSDHMNANVTLHKLAKKCLSDKYGYNFS